MSSWENKDIRPNLTPANRWPMIVAVTLLTVGLMFQCIGAWQDSQTSDEAVHLAAGVSYWRTGDFRLNPEHPPLTKLLAALPVMAFTHWPVPIPGHRWDIHDEWGFSEEYLYPSTLSMIDQSRLILFWARLPMILLWALLAILILLTAWHWWSPLAGLVSMTFFIFDPNFLGHGHLVTNDVALTLLFLGTTLAARRFFLKPSWRTLGVLVLVFALAQITKFSALALWPIVIVLGLLTCLIKPQLLTWAWMGKMMAALLLVSGITIWLAYGLTVAPVGQDPRIARLWQERAELVAQAPVETYRGLTGLALRLTDRSSPWYTQIVQVESWSVPAYSYWRGVFSVVSHEAAGHGSFLLGQASRDGWWYYFPVAFLLKTPWLTLFLGLIALMYWVKKLWDNEYRWSWASWLITLPPLMFFAWGLTSSINIGLRHIFPVYPFLYLALGWLVAEVGQRRWSTGAWILAMAGSLTVALTAWPHTIGYYSGLVGGTNQGHRYILDSNLDWGQDVWRLRDFLVEHRLSLDYISLFSNMPLDRIFVGAQPLPTDRAVNQETEVYGLMAVSQGFLFDPASDRTWLRTLKPSWTIGSSIYVYDLRKHDSRVD